MIQGRQINLRPLEEQDLHIIAEWRNQKEVRRSFFTSSLISHSGQKKWFDNYLKDQTKEIFVAVNKETDAPVGMISLYHINYRDHNAEIGSTIVGDSSMWGKGIGTEMIRMMLDYAFTDLGLNRVYAYALDFNTGSIRAKEKCGFKIEGTLRQSSYKEGRFYDAIFLGITRTDWNKLLEYKKE